MDYSSCAVVCITSYPRWYRGKLRSIKHTDKIRGDIALEFFCESLTRGCNMIVSDEGSSKTFRKAVKNLPEIIFINRRVKKRSPAKRHAIERAIAISGIRAIVLTEPEKLSLITDCLPQILEPVLSGQADIVVPNRKEALFKSTYPYYQYESESEGNRMYNEELRSHALIPVVQSDLDMFFGPRVFSTKKSVISLFMKSYHFTIAHMTFPHWYFDVESFSNTLYFPVIMALKKKMRITGVEVPFRYPELQKHNEERGERELFLEKRKAQRISIIVELLHFIAFLENYRAIRIKST